MTILQKVEQALTEVRPYLQNDGGDVELVSVEEGVVAIKWKGYCASCAKSMMTLNGLTEIIKSMVPEVKEVIEV